MIDRQIAKPMPMPLDLVVNNGLKMRSTIFGSIPFPVSATEISTPPGSRAADPMRKIRGHFFSAMASIALVIRFTSTIDSLVLVANHATNRRPDRPMGAYIPGSVGRDGHDEHDLGTALPDLAPGLSPVLHRYTLLKDEDAPIHSPRHSLS